MTKKYLKNKFDTQNLSLRSDTFFIFCFKLDLITLAQQLNIKKFILLKKYQNKKITICHNEILLLYKNIGYEIFDLSCRIRIETEL